MAKDIDEEVETLDELKAKYRKELEAAKEVAFDDAVESAALELAVENAEIVELPEEMIHEEVHRAINEFLGGMQQQGISPDMYFKSLVQLVKTFINNTKQMLKTYEDKLSC